MLIAKNIATACSPGPLLGSVLGVGFGLVEDEDGLGVVVPLLLLGLGVAVPLLLLLFGGLGAVAPLLLLLVFGVGGAVTEVEGAFSAGLGEDVVP
jgi:hypothetical protein